jgi:hypothetical protein
MVHPITGEHITSYHKPMKDPTTSEGMSQGNIKTNTKSRDAIVVMDPQNIPNIPKNQPPT